MSIVVSQAWIDRIDHESGGWGGGVEGMASDLSSLTVLRTISRSHNEAQKTHCKQIHKPMEYTSRIFSFLPCTIDFSGINSVEIHKSKAYLSYLIVLLTRYGPQNHI